MELRPLLDDDDLDPHPALVASQSVTPAEVMAVACVRGWLPDVPYLSAAVPMTR